MNYTSTIYLPGGSAVSPESNKVTFLNCLLNVPCFCALFPKKR